jgi:hypothetical protein
MLGSPSWRWRISSVSLQGTPADGAPTLKVLRVVEIRPMPPKASGKPEWPKSSNHPVSSGL